MRRVLSVMALVVGLCGPVGAQLYGEWMADNLATGCLPMGFSTHFWGDEEDDGRLERSLNNAGESRLRTAGVYTPDGWEQYGLDLSFSVSTLAQASRVDLRLFRFVRDLGNGKPGTVIAWAASSIGIHGDAQDYRNTLAEMLDHFLTEYLRANPGCR